MSSQVDKYKKHAQVAADFWASQYKPKASSEQIQKFKEVLTQKIEIALSECVWDEQEPRAGAYGRRFIAYRDSCLSPALEESAKESGLNPSFLSFNSAVLSIDPDGVKEHPSGKIIWTP